MKHSLLATMAWPPMTNHWSNYSIVSTVGLSASTASNPSAASGARTPGSAAGR